MSRGAPHTRHIGDLLPVSFHAHLIIHALNSNSKRDSNAEEDKRYKASVDQSTRTRIEGSFSRENASSKDFEVDEADSWRAPAQGLATWIRPWAPPIPDV